MEKEHFGIFFSDEFQSTDVSWWYMQQKDHILCQHSSLMKNKISVISLSHDIHMQFFSGTQNTNSNQLFFLQQH